MPRPRFLTDAAYRERLARYVKHPSIRAFLDDFESWNSRYRQEAVAPVINKVATFVTNPNLHAIIGQPTSSFDFRWLMDERKILLCHLSKGALGEGVTSLLGSMIVTKLSLAALSREDLPEADRVQHFLYADEVQNFIHGIDFPTILSEARKYRLALTIATQTLEQLPLVSRRAVLGNCATIISYRVSGEDAEVLHQEFATLGDPAALQELPDYHLYLRTLKAGDPLKPDKSSRTHRSARSAESRRRSQL